MRVPGVIYRHCFVFVFFLALCGGIVVILPRYANGQSASNSAAYPMGMWQVLLPQGVAVEKKRAIDFDLYYFTIDVKAIAGETAKTKRQLLFAYSGWHPSFPQEVPKGVKEARSKINKWPARTFAWKDKNGGLCRETLVEIPSGVSGNGPPIEKVHFAYSGLTHDEAITADGIIATLQTAPKP